eukprot:10361677-Heterocapsa_arctica.AAC.1
MIQTGKEEADRQVTELHKRKIEAYQQDIFELNATVSPWVTEMTMDQALMIRLWILTIDADSMTKQIQ